MAVLLNNVPCSDPAALARSCAALAVRADWFGTANAYRCPDGPAPGEGHVLLSLSALRRLDPSGALDGAYGLEFIAEGPTREETRALIPGLIATACECVTPGARGSEAAYLLTLADRRLTDGRAFVDVGYNLTHRFAGHTLTEKKTWQGAADDLWDAAGIPGSPTLPATPPSDPEDLEYWQWPALQALDDLAARCGCRLVYDPVGAEYRFAEAGAADGAFDAALAARRGLLVWDAYSRPPARGRVPAEVRVLFAKRVHVRGLDGSPWHAVARPDPDASSRPWAGAAASGAQLLHDDLAAEYDARGELLNGGDLEDRADARAAAYFRELAALLDDQRLVYGGALDDEGFRPGPLVSAVAWSDTGSRRLPGRGVITAVTRRGSPLAPPFGPRTVDPLTEVVRLTGSSQEGPGGAQLHDARVQRWDPLTGRWVDRQRVWLIDAAQ